jgi:hypothetical protein
MARFCGIVVTISVVAALVVLIGALQTTGEHSTQSNIARIVTAFLVLLLSLGAIKLLLSYNSLSKNSASSEAAAERALQGSNVEQIEALRIMYDYHHSRALGPIIPTWIWKRRQASLNQTWQALRNRKIVDGEAPR